MINRVGGVIHGSSEGVRIKGVGALTNSGSVGSHGAYGVYFSVGGIVRNFAGARITSDYGAAIHVAGARGDRKSVV